MRNEFTRPPIHPALNNGRKTVALFSASLASFYQASIAFGVADYAKQQDHNLICFAGGPFRNPDAVAVSRTSVFDIVNEEAFDALIIIMGSLSRFINEDEMRAFLARFAHIPVVNIGSVVEGLPSVITDNAVGIKALVRHLVRGHGFTHIAFASGPENHESSEEKLRAYAEAMRESGLGFDRRLVSHGQLNRNSPTAYVDELLRADPHLQAIMTVNDNQALAVIDHLQARGLRVPQDIVVTGCMGVEEGLFSEPALTTVTEPMYELGWHAAKAVAACLNGETLPSTIVIPTELTVRNSCGCTAVRTADAACEAATPVFPAGGTAETDALAAELLAIVHQEARTTGSRIDSKDVRAVAAAARRQLEHREETVLADTLEALLERYMKREEITLWLKLVHALQSRLVSLLAERDELGYLEELVGMLGRLTHRVHDKALAFRRYESDKYINLFRDINIFLNASFDIDIIKKILVRDLGVTDCYVSIYEDGNNVRGGAKNIVALQGAELLTLEGSARQHPSVQLLPHGVRPYPATYAFFVLPLSFRTEAIGYLVLNVCDRKGSVYESLRALLSSALKNEIQIQDLREAEARFSDIAHSTSDWLWEADTDYRYTYCSGGVRDVIGYSAEEMIGRSLFDFLLPGDSDYVDLLRDQLMAQRQPLDNIEHVAAHKKGHEVTLRISGKPIIKEGRFVGYRGAFKDTTDIKQKENRIRLLAYSDLLTGLPNRALFNDRLDVAMAQAQRDGQQFAILFLDLDRFKNVNDTLGHDAGDQLLQAVAEKLRTCVREGDTLARLGGDEFTIILSRIEGGEDAAVVARRIVAELAAPIEVKGHQLFVTASIGIAVYPHDGESAQTLMKNADKAMYKAKDQGKNRFMFYDNEMEEKNNRRMALETILHRAISEEGFQVYYQPQVNVESGEIVGAEALLRLFNTELGAVSPIEFIGLAEEIGLIEKIGLWVFESACRQARAWQDEGRRVRVAVNVSGRQFKNPGLAESLLDAIARHGVDASLIQIEMTENAVIENEGTAKDILQRLKEAGVSIALDDFGTGYSSLSSLKKFPVDTVKIDRSFISDVTTNRDSANIVNAIVHIAKSLNLAVVAEGVERSDQLLFLQAIGCVEIQGFLFSQAVPADAFTDSLRRGFEVELVLTD